MSKYSGIITMGKKQYPSLVFDFSQLSNVGDYYKEYKIPEQEKPLVYAYSGEFFSFRLEGSGTLITDEAIYFHPSHRDWAKSNRFPLSSLCSYIVFQENERDNVQLISQKGRVRIFGRTVAPHDTTGSELMELLKALQQALIIGSREKKEFEKTLGFLLAEVRGSLGRNGLLNDKHKMLLGQIEDYGLFATETAFIRAEHLYRMCDMDEYFRFVDALGDEVDESVRTSLKNPDNIFFDSYIRDISNVAAFYMTKELIQPYLNLKRLPKLTLNQCVIESFLCIRLEDPDYFRLLSEIIKQYIAADNFWTLAGFDVRLKNERMSGIYEKLLSKLELSSADYAEQDALGLTPLHYALIMRDGRLCRRLLEEYDWRRYIPPFLDEPDVCAVYDFVFAASCLFDDAELISDIVLATYEPCAPLKRARKQLTTSIEIHRRLLEKASAGDDLEAVRHHQEQLDEYHEMKKEVECEIKKLVASRITEARKRAETIIEQKHPVTRYVLHLYLTPDALYRSIADSITDWRVYRYRGHFFVTSLDHELELSFYEWQKGHITLRKIIETDIADESDDASKKSEYFDGDKFVNPETTRYKKQEEEEKEKRRKKAEEDRRKRRERFAKQAAASAEDSPYGNSFFSPAAHKNISILKKEYRKLVKRYHPDSGGDAHDVEIMLIIMNERADILERM